MPSEISSRCQGEHRSFISALFGEIIAAKEAAETHSERNAGERPASALACDDTDFRLRSPPAPSVDRCKRPRLTEVHTFDCGSRR